MRPVTPMPASAPMDQERADWYVRHTKGQLQAVPIGSTGTSYLYEPAPVSATDPAGTRPA